MSPEQSRWSGLTDDALTTLDELLSRQRDEILAAASRKVRGPIDAVDVLRAYNTSLAPTTDNAALDTESRIAASERRVSSLVVSGLTVLFVAVLASGMLVLLNFVLPILNVPDVMLAYFAVALGVVLLTTSGIWVLIILNHRARARHEEYRLQFRALSSAQGTLHQSLSDFAEDEDSLEEEALAAEEASINRYAFLGQWITIEKQIYQLAELALGPSDGRRSISAVVRSLVHDGVISDDAEFRIKRVLLSRNEVVHREHPRLDWSRLEYDMKQIDIELTAAAKGLRVRRGHSTST